MVKYENFLFKNNLTNSSFIVTRTVSNNESFEGSFLIIFVKGNFLESIFDNLRLFKFFKLIFLVLKFLLSI